MEKRKLFVVLLGLFTITFGCLAQSVINVDQNAVYPFPTPKPTNYDIGITNVIAIGEGVTIQSYDKNYVKLKFATVGLIEVSVYTYGIVSPWEGEYVPVVLSAKQTFNVKEVNYNIVPNITGISGPLQVVLGYSEYYQVTPAYNESFIKYEWKVDGRVVGYDKPYLTHTFTKVGYTALSCKATNTVTGVSGNIFNRTINVQTQSRSMSDGIDQSYILFNQPGMLVVTEAETNGIINAVSTIKTINYQLSNLYTGVSVAKGTVQVGSSIDTGTLPAGLYILSLMDGSQVETHKIVIK